MQDILQQNNLNLNWSLSYHIKNQNIKEAEMVAFQMTKEELLETQKSCKFFLSSKANQRKFTTRYKIVKGRSLPAIQFLNKKLELVELALSKLQN